MSKDKAKAVDLSALDSLDNLSMDGLLGGGKAGDSSQNPVITSATRDPIEVELSDLHEDENQPRTVFSEKSLEELAESIRRYGILMPIAVRPDAQKGGYKILAGARRYRAAQLAGLQKMPVVIRQYNDAETTRYAQMIENLQRDNLTHLEIATFVAEELASGKKQKEVAEYLAKDKAEISRYVALAKAQDWIQELFRSERCKDLMLISMLEKAAKNPAMREKIQALPEVTRSSISALTEEKQTQGEESGTPLSSLPQDDAVEETPESGAPLSSLPQDHAAEETPPAESGAPLSSLPQDHAAEETPPAEGEAPLSSLPQDDTAWDDMVSAASKKIYVTTSRKTSDGEWEKITGYVYAATLPVVFPDRKRRDVPVSEIHDIGIDKYTI